MFTCSNMRLTYMVFVIVTTCCVATGSNEPGYFIRYENYAIQKPAAVIALDSDVTPTECAMRCRLSVGGCQSFNFRKNVVHGACIYHAASLADVPNNGALMLNTGNKDYYELGQHQQSFCNLCTSVHPQCDDVIGSCYHVAAVKLGTAEAEGYCQGLGLYLVSVDSMQEFHYLRGIAANCDPTIDRLLCVYWTGLVTHSVTARETQSLHTGAIYTETEWWATTIEPSSVSDCVFFMDFDNFYFHDGACAAQQAFICEGDMSAL